MTYPCGLDVTVETCHLLSLRTCQIRRRAVVTMSKTQVHGKEHRGMATTMGITFENKPASGQSPLRVPLLCML